jgi:hypothetical protein
VDSTRAALAADAVEQALRAPLLVVLARLCAAGVLRLKVRRKVQAHGRCAHPPRRPDIFERKILLPRVRQAPLHTSIKSSY